MADPIDLFAELRKVKATETPSLDLFADLRKNRLNWSDVPREAVKNVGGSAASFAKSVVQPFLDPVGTVQGLYDVGKGVASKAAGLVVDQDPEQKAKTEASANAVGAYFADRYGGVENLKKTIAKDPVGFMADASIALTGGGSLVARAPGAIGQAGAAVRTAGSAIDPIANVGRAVRGAATVGKNALGVTTGAGEMPIRTAFEAGRAGGSPQFADAMRGQAPVRDVVDMAENAVSQLTKERGAAYRGLQQPLFSNRKQLDLTPIRTAISNQLDSVSYAGQAVDEGAARALLKVAETVAKYENMPNGIGRVPAGLDAMKRSINPILDNLKPGTNSYRVVKNVYDEVGRQIRAQVPSYDKMMRNYSQASDQLAELRRTFSINPNAAADTTARKLLSVTRNNVNTNYGERARLFDAMARIEPDLPAAVAGHALSSATPRGLRSVTATGAGVGGVAGNPLLLATLPAFSPRLVGETVYLGGRAVGVVDAVANRLGVSPSVLRQTLMASYATSGPLSEQNKPQVEGVRERIARQLAN